MAREAISHLIPYLSVAYICLERVEIQSVKEDRRDKLNEIEGIKPILDMLKTRSKDSSNYSTIDLTTIYP